MKVVVSLTTIPDRLERGFPYKNVKYFYENQTQKPDLIIINIPKISSKGVEYNKQKADEFKNIGPNIIVNWGVEDLGPITKLIPSLEYLNKNNISNYNIILIDDDCIYGNDLISSLLNLKNEHPDKKAIGYQGFIYNSNAPIYVANLNLTSGFIECDVLETYAGVLYSFKLFQPLYEFRNFAINLPEDIKKADDIIIGAWVRKNGNKLYRFNSNIVEVRHDAEDTTQLRNVNLEHGNVRSMTYFAGKGNYINNSNSIQWIYICSLIASVIFTDLIVFLIIKIILWSLEKKKYNF